MMANKCGYLGVVVLIADGQPDRSGEVLNIADVVVPETVKVTHGFSEKIEDFLGTATLRKDGNRVLADISLTTNKIPSELRKLLYPAIGGQVEARDGNIIKKCRIDSLSLSTSENTDPRIGKLED